MEKFKGKKMFECGDAIKALLEKYGLTLTGKVATSQDVRCPWDKDGIFGIRYRVTLARPKVHALEYTFDFWDSVYAKEHGEILKGDSVLETIVRDCSCADDFRDFCSEFGYDESNNGRSTFNQIQKFKQGIFSVIGQVELTDQFSEQLNEIMYP